MKSKAPAFQLYAADFLTDTMDWSAAQVGVYFRLLLYEWINGAIPNDYKRMARIAGIDIGNFKKCYLQDIAEKLTLNSKGELVNERLEDTREKQQKYIENQRIAGKKGADKRWKSDSDPNGNPNDDPNGRKMALQSSSSPFKE